MNVLAVVLIVLICVIVVAGFASLAFVSTRSNLLKFKLSVKESFDALNVVTKKRYDLIPMLIQIAKNDQNANVALLEKIVQARYSCMSSADISEKSKNEKLLDQSLADLFAEAGKSKVLKKNQDFQDIQARLQEIQKDILDAKLTYNGLVNALNHKIDAFPSKYFAKKLDIKKEIAF